MGALGDGAMGPDTGKVLGLMTTHVDDILIAASGNVVELVGAVFDVTFDQLKHKRLTKTALITSLRGGGTRKCSFFCLG